MKGSYVFEKKKFRKSYTVFESKSVKLKLRYYGQTQAKDGKNLVLSKSEKYKRNV